MEFLGNLLAARMKNHGIGHSTEAAVFIARANKHLADFFGSKTQNFIRAKTMDHGIITVEISSPTWAQEFQFIREPFLEKLRNDFPTKDIRNLKIRILGEQAFHNPDAHDDHFKEAHS